MQVAKVTRFWDRHFERGVGTVLLTVVAVVWALLVLVASARAFVLAAFALTIWGAVLLGVLWVAMLIGGLRMREWNQAVVLVPAIMLSGALVAATPLPLLARFAVSASGFDSSVASTGPPVTVSPAESERRRAANPTDTPPGQAPVQPSSHWFGLFRVWGPEPFDGGYLYRDADAWWGSDDAGIAYVPDHRPDQRYGREGFEDPDFVHIWGPWYAYSARW